MGLVAIALIGGSIPFILFFSGLALATAPTAAFIQKTLFIWVAFMAVPLLGERLGLVQVIAMAGLLAGLLLIAPPLGMGWGIGETMIAAATLLWAVEVVVAKRLLVGVSLPCSARHAWASGGLPPRLSRDLRPARRAGDPGRRGVDVDRDHRCPAGGLRRHVVRGAAPRAGDRRDEHSRGRGPNHGLLPRRPRERRPMAQSCRLSPRGPGGRARRFAATGRMERIRVDRAAAEA